MTIRQIFQATAIVSLLSACSGGVSIDAGDEVNSSPLLQTVSADDALSEPQAALAINDPINRINEPDAVDWVSAQRQNSNQTFDTQCVEGIQNAVDTFSTNAFIRASDDSGEYLISNPAAASQPAEYIEFCFTIPELGRYQFVANVQAPSVLEDSFFVTVNEDEPGSVPNPGIYDVANSDGFVDQIIRTRTHSPLVPTLEPGTVTLRLYIREPNTAIRSIRLDTQVEGVASFDPEISGTTELAQCAANTGMTESEIDSLIQLYLGNVARRFVLSPADEERSDYANRNDYQWLTNDGIANIMCLASPPAGENGTNLIDNTVAANRIVFGSEGIDEQRANTPLLGTFIGNGGDDSIGVLEAGGVYIGGEGNDTLTYMLGGLFEGGPGDDEIIGAQSGTFIGGTGNDQVINLAGDFFDGGEGIDSFEQASDTATFESIENPGNTNSDLLPPSNLQFIDPTQLNTLLTWSASEDDRVDGYVVNEVGADRNLDLNIELGLPPSIVGRFGTFDTTVIIDRFETTERIFQVRSFEEVGSRSFIYSQPIEIQYIAPALPAQPIIANRDVLFDPTRNNFSGVTLADDASVVRFFEINQPILVNYGSDLESNDEFIDDSLLFFRMEFTGDSRQYIVIGGERFDQIPQIPLLTALSGDGLSILWQQELEIRGANVPDCSNIFISQDDWFVCLERGQGINAFDPTGTQYRYPDAGFQNPISQGLLDADAGLLVRWFELEFTSVDLFTGQQTRVSTDLQEFIPDNRVGLITALAVSNGQAVVAGVQRSRGCSLEIESNCAFADRGPQGFFLARIDLTTGSVLRFSSLPIESRPVPFDSFTLSILISKTINDTFVLAYDNFVNTYNIDSLELISRQEVTGIVQDVIDGVVLSQDRIISENPGALIGFELILTER